MRRLLSGDGKRERGRRKEEGGNSESSPFAGKNTVEKTLCMATYSEGPSQQRVERYAVCRFFFFLLHVAKIALAGCVCGGIFRGALSLK